MVAIQNPYSLEEFHGWLAIVDYMVGLVIN